MLNATFFSISFVSFFISFLLYTWLQFLTTKYEGRFRFINLLLIIQIASAWITIYQALWKNAETKFPDLLWFFLGIWSIFCLGLVLARELFLDDLRIRSPKYVTRMRTRIGVKHEMFDLKTSDGIILKGFRIPGGHQEVLILCHGGFRSKNEASNALLAQWLSYDFDIISFDARGHYESEGYWSGDGKSTLDLVAMLNYAKEFGYKKIGVLGRSLGGWTAMLTSVNNKDVDSLVLISSPLGELQNIPQIKRLGQLSRFLGPLIKAAQGLRYRYNMNSVSPPPDLAERLKMPLFLIYPQRDPVAGIEEQEVRRFFERVAVKKKLHIFPDELHLLYSWHLGPVYQLILEWFTDTLKR